MEGIDNTGVVIDTWHMGKLGITPDDLRRFSVEQLGWIELSDGQYEDMEDTLDEVVNRRKLPGEGEFDIRGYVRVGARHGLQRAAGESRCSRRTCARFRSTRCTGAPTRAR